MEVQAYENPSPGLPSGKVRVHIPHLLLILETCPWSSDENDLNFHLHQKLLFQAPGHYLQGLLSQQLVWVGFLKRLCLDTKIWLYMFEFFWICFSYLMRLFVCWMWAETCWSYPSRVTKQPPVLFHWRRSCSGHCRRCCSGYPWNAHIVIIMHLKMWLIMLC